MPSSRPAWTRDVPASDKHTKQLLSQYLFEPSSDGETPIERLSGGQKARFQLIRMLVDNPIVLILDEPTNHLDLPSIEELEDALAQIHTAPSSTSRTTASSPIRSAARPLTLAPKSVNTLSALLSHCAIISDTVAGLIRYSGLAQW